MEQKCTVCGHDENKIVEHRGARRRRECGRCGHRWTTYEVPAERLEVLETLESHAEAIAAVLAPAGSKGTG